MISTPQIPTPPTPPNPPQFGSTFQRTAADRQRQGAGVSGFGGTILGNSNPANTGAKTLLGQ